MEAANAKLGTSKILVEAVKNSLYVLRESIVCSLVQVSPSFPALAVAWVYTRIRDSEAYLKQPMDEWLDMIAWWMLLVGCTCLSMDVVAFVSASARCEL